MNHHTSDIPPVPLASSFKAVRDFIEKERTARMVYLKGRNRGLKIAAADHALRQLEKIEDYHREQAHG